MTFDIPGFAYAAFVAAGGIMGYVKSKSIPSLGAGLIFGTLLGYGAFQTSRNPNNFGLILGTSAVLGGMMGYRYYQTQKIMPAAVIALVSTLMIVRYSLRYLNKPIQY